MWLASSIPTWNIPPRETRECWWVLRYLTGDAFAISDFHEESHLVPDDACGIPIPVWYPSQRFKKIVLLPDRSAITNYTVERTTKTGYETLREFGIPVVCMYANGNKPNTTCLMISHE